MAKTEEKQKKQPKKKNERYFYQKWWFWITISIILCCANIAYAIWGCKTENKSDILTAISGWISGVATLVVGIIAYRQSEKYKLENDEFIQEQKDLAWRNNYAELVQRFAEQLNEHLTNLSKYYPHKLEALFLKNLGEKCFYDYELQVSDFEEKTDHFLIFLRKSQIFNNNHKEMYDAFILLYHSLYQLILYFQKVLNKERIYDKDACGVLVKKALQEYREFIDLAYAYKENLSRLISDIYEMDIDTLKISYEYQKMQREKWYIEVKDIPAYIKKKVTEKMKKAEVKDND